MNTKPFQSLLAILICCGSTCALGADTNLPGAKDAAPPDFGPNVLIFDSSMTNIQEQLNAVIATQQRAQFGTNRYAYLFKPGKYELDVQIAFYMHMMGLGRSPDDVQITGAVRSRSTRGALVNFWRTAENFSVVPTIDTNNVNTWAVSQAATMRRTHIKGNLNLTETGGASGGYLADSKVDGTVASGSQQQWFSRNDEWGTWRGGVWSMVFVGTINPPTGQWPARPYTVVEKTPLVREKPYLIIDAAGKYAVFVPALKTNATQGTSWSGGATTAGTALLIRGVWKPEFTSPQNRKYDFISDRMDTRGKFDFAYGTWAARMKLTAAPGLWPAFWALGTGRWPDCGEIDIMENIGQPDWISSALHERGNTGRNASQETRFHFPKGKDITGWHIYSVDWSPDSLVFKVDGEVSFTVTKERVTQQGAWAFDNQKYVILNLALGGGYPASVNKATMPYRGLPDATVQLIKDGKAKVLVDWVRVTKR